MTESVYLNELVDIYLGLTHTPEYVLDGVPFLSVKNISSGTIDFSQCNYITEEEYNSLPNGAKPQCGDMLFCRVGTIGKPVIIEEDTPRFGSFVSLGFFRVKDNNLCKLKYLYYWMYSESFYSQVRKNVKGASQVNLNTGWLKNFRLPLYSLATQAEIVQKLEEVDRLITLRKEQLAKLDELVKSRFIELFGGFIGVEDPVDFESICEFVTVGIANSATHAFCDNGVIMLRNQNIKEDYLDTSDIVQITSEFAAKYKSKKLKKDDLLIVRTGYPGVACLVPEQYEGSQTFTTLIARLKDTNVINPRFICHYINSEYGKKYVRDNSAGAAQQNFGATALSKLPICIPPIELQDKYIRFVEQTDKSKLAIQESLTELETLKKALMQKYFG